MAALLLRVACKQLEVHVSTDRSFLHSAGHRGGAGPWHAAVTVTNKKHAHIHKHKQICMLSGIAQEHPCKGSGSMRAFAGEIHIHNRVWILFDIQSGCVKAAGCLIGTRNREKIDSRELEDAERSS